MLEERWTEYLRLYREGATYSSFVKLAEINHCLGYAPQLLTQKWSATIQNVPITDDDVQSLRAGVAQKIQRLQRIVSAGTHFMFEETLLLVTMRVELELLSAFLVERGIVVTMDVAALDDALQAIATSPVNARAFRSAQDAAKQNWGIPLHTRWLESPTVQ